MTPKLIRLPARPSSEPKIPMSTGSQIGMVITKKIIPKSSSMESAPKRNTPG